MANKQSRGLAFSTCCARLAGGSRGGATYSSAAPAIGVKWDRGDGIGIAHRA